MLRLGFIYPMHAAEDDYPFFASRVDPAVEAHVVHTYSEDVHETECCLRTGSPERIAPGIEALSKIEVDACMWACTSGSFVFGVKGAQEQVDGIAEKLGCPTSSTSLAFLNALKTLNLTRVAVAATYPEDLALEFKKFLGEGGFEVLHLGCEGIWTAEEVGVVEQTSVLEFAKSNDHPDAEAVLIPDTALHSAQFLAELEAHVGKTVLTANQVTIWEALRLANYESPQAGLGQIMTQL